MIVRAKLKPLEALPDWAVCCEPMRKSIEVERDRIVQVDASQSGVDTSVCFWCGARVEDRVVMALVSRLPLASGFTPTMIFVDSFDFDEGGE